MFRAVHHRGGRIPHRRLCCIRRCAALVVASDDSHGSQQRARTPGSRCLAGTIQPSGNGVCREIRSEPRVRNRSEALMALARQLEVSSDVAALPATMRAAVYRGPNDVRMETVPVPEIGPGELLIRVHTCGICGTDLKKIATGSHGAPRIFGHETAWMVAATGPAVRRFHVGDRVMAFHHIPCGDCYYCQHKVFAQCPTYKKVGCTAGFEPSGGGFAEYVRVMDWIVEKGVVRIPDDVSFEQACFVEPLNTCLKGIYALNL